MANESRLWRYFKATVADNPLTAGATTLNIAGGTFAVVDSAHHQLLILDPDGVAGAPEIVRVTAAVAGATSATVVRGVDGTAARQHAQGVAIVSGPVVSDLIRSPDVPWGGDLGYDVEFDTDGSSLPNGWSWVNQGSCTYLQQYGTGRIHHPGTSPYSNTAIVRPLPAEATWSAYGKFTGAWRDGDAAVGGFCLHESSSGKIIAYGVRTAGTTYQIIAQHWNSATSWSGNGDANIQMPSRSLEFTLRLVRNSATNYDLYAGPSFVAQHKALAGLNPTAFCTPSHIGIFLGVWMGSGVDAQIACHWFRVR